MGESNLALLTSLLLCLAATVPYHCFILGVCVCLMLCARGVRNYCRVIKASRRNCSSREKALMRCFTLATQTLPARYEASSCHRRWEVMLVWVEVEVPVVAAVTGRPERKHSRHRSKSCSPRWAQEDVCGDTPATDHARSRSGLEYLKDWTAMRASMLPMPFRNIWSSCSSVRSCWKAGVWEAQNLTVKFQYSFL